MKRLKIDKRGISNAIVAMLSLVLIALIVSNVILWSYQMNQLDWEKSQEKTVISKAERVTNSNWISTQVELSIEKGKKLSGSYVDTSSMDNVSEVFTEMPDGLAVAGIYALDFDNYHAADVHSMEIMLRYRVNGSNERLFLEVFNGTAFCDIGFNSTEGNLQENDFAEYALNLTNRWQAFVYNGSMTIRLSDTQLDTFQTTFEIDFLAVRMILDGARISVENNGPVTSHIVAIWVLNDTAHMRYDSDFYVNSGARTEILRADISLPSSGFILKIVTELGNSDILRL